MNVSFTQLSAEIIWNVNIFVRVVNISSCLTDKEFESEKWKLKVSQSFS